MSTNRIHAFTDDILAQHDAVGIADLVRRKEVRASEIIAAAIERCKAVNPQINAVAEEDFERALETANAEGKDTSAPFYGVPMFIKDQVTVAGLTCRFGSRAFDKASPAKKNAPFADQLFKMGFINLGTSTLPEFGFTCSTEFPDAPPTRNPWNLERTPGGSSGGTAALVASGVLPMAHGADGGGSIRIPANCCGLVGLKASRARLVEEPVAKILPVNIVTDGVLSRSVRDTAMYFSEAEKLHRNPKLTPVGHIKDPLNRPLRIGTFIDSPVGAVDAPTRKTFEDTIALLTSLGHEVSEITLPVDEQFAEDFTHFWAMLAFFVDRFGKRLFDSTFDRDALTDLTKGLSKKFASNKWSTIGVIKRLRKSSVSYAELSSKVDVVLSPVVTHIPPELGCLGMDLPFDVLFPRVEKWTGFTPYCNATGGPSISLPLGHDPETNTPIGMMFSTGLGEERLLLALALQLEDAKPWKKIWA